jgi:hypothetical protein
LTHPAEFKNGGKLTLPAQFAIGGIGLFDEALERIGIVQVKWRAEVVGNPVNRFEVASCSAHREVMAVAKHS